MTVSASLYWHSFDWITAVETDSRIFEIVMEKISIQPRRHMTSSTQSKQTEGRCHVEERSEWSLMMGRER